ncbi:MAG: prephenate dehydrogenase/arogenate dehydrogenase family protein [Anaerolineaceae bacterium]|nr:prephenate dehydrogenase/arogenate dehydrogenase family protein [Anaerolineaceae bacterium]MCY3935664.1 prephenate dehydrogenase/arogenate dehydrogenase family protein [Chloroflexota bacterium]MCY4009599.1 prephenate dehydrogenase/arogenate dehydrogenase family protein [Anaerolineaceae bacterium]
MTRNVGILGYGRFGAFWAQLHAADFAIHVHSRSPRREQVEQDGFRWHDTEASLCSHVDALFLCVSIGAMEATLARIVPLLPAGTVVMDTCSVKVWPTRWFTEQLASRPDVEILACHPLFGPDSAAQGVRGLPLVLFPLRCQDETFAYWHDHFVRLGLAVHEMEPHEHDRLAAYSQGLTHFIGRVLDELDLNESPIDTVGFRHLLSIIRQTCDDSMELFYELQTYNPYTGEMRERLDAAFKKISEQLNRQE